jgi:hypothetical protein
VLIAGVFVAMSIGAVSLANQSQPPLNAITIAADPQSGGYVSPQNVKGPHNHSTINRYGGLSTLSDEHSSIFKPGEIAGPDTDDYLFFVASKTSLNAGQAGTSGLVVLKALNGGPDANGEWTLDFATRYGLYNPNGNPAARNGQVFLAPMARLRCPIAADPTLQDQTFDLNYANAGSVVMDPTNADNVGPGNLIMIYDATNRCVGLTITTKKEQDTPRRAPFYGSIGIATSFDAGVTWPTYPMVDYVTQGLANLALVYLPNQSKNFGPNAPFVIGGLGGMVCDGNSVVNLSSIILLVNPACTPPLPPSQKGFAYGRYPVLAPPVTIAEAERIPATFPGQVFQTIGDAEPSAFVDEPGKAGVGATYLYVVYGYTNSNTEIGPAANGELMIAQAQLGLDQRQPLAFSKWVPSLGTFSGLPNQNDGAILPMQDESAKYGNRPWLWPSYSHCQASGHQAQSMGSINYVDETAQYVLTFVCRSNFGEPGLATNKLAVGHSLFYSILKAGTPLNQQQWSPPVEIQGSWFINPAVAADYIANYPTFMSLNARSGHISTAGGYIFGMSGCANGACAGTGGRRYMSWKFSIE